MKQEINMWKEFKGYFSCPYCDEDGEKETDIILDPSTDEHIGQGRFYRSGICGNCHGKIYVDYEITNLRKME